MNTHPACLIVANGDLTDLAWLKRIAQQSDLIIAADGGCEHLRQAAVIPSLVIGDLDSISEQTQEWITQNAIVTNRYPIDKDWSDLELALHYAVDHYAGKIYIAGALGGRADQTMANLLLLAHPHWLAREIEIVRPNERIWLFSGEGVMSAEVGDTISLLPVAGDVTVAASDGLKWPLNNGVLRFGFARGISNILDKTTATISLESGILACFVTKQTWQR